MALLRRAAEPLPLQRRKEQLQLLDFGIALGQRRPARCQLSLLPLQHVCQITHHPLQ
jgi:hypothetical protein